MKGKKWGEKLYKRNIASDKIKQIAGFHYDFHATERPEYTTYKFALIRRVIKHFCAFLPETKNNGKKTISSENCTIEYYSYSHKSASSFSQAHFYK